jgi:cold shock CspA family protein
MTNTRVVGKIIKVSKTGWGFISSKEIEFTRIFFHWTSLTQDTITFPELRTGMLVEFSPLQIQGRGWRANHVKVIKSDKDKGQKHDQDNLSVLP